MLTLHFEKLYNRDRLDQPAYISIPLPKGELFDTDKIRFYQEHKMLLVQPRVLSRYKDGSIRYLFLRFLADIPANQGTIVTGDLHGEADFPVFANTVVPNLTCEKIEHGFEVSTGAIHFTLRNHTDYLFEEVKAFETNYTKEQFVGPTLKLEGTEQMLTMQYGKWKMIEDGPVCVILSNKGKMLPAGISTKAEEPETPEEGMLCELRITVFAGGANADIEVRLINATGEQQNLAAYEFVFRNKVKEAGTAEDYEENPVPIKVRSCVASSNYKTDFLISEDGETVEKEITAESLINQSNEHFAEVLYGTFFADWTTETGGICATVYQAHQNFPKAVAAGREGIVIKLIPEGSTPIVMQSGMAVAQQFQLYFHRKELELQEINHQSILYQMPDRPILEAEVYERSGLYPDIFVKKEKQVDDVECALMMAADNHIRSYGMMNWGDAPDPNYTTQGRGGGKLVWTNNEYDFPHACMLQFVRTGIRRFADYCVVAGMHQMNVDVCHYSKDELLLGGQWEHTAGHCFGEMACSHEWVEGILDCYHLTGDRRFYDTAIGIGENILRLLDTPQYQETGGLNARETGWALRTLTALYRETFDEKWNKKSEWIVGQFKEWADRYGGWLAPYLDNVVIRVPFMISVAVGSLMRYYREFPREDIKEMIINAVDDMLNNCMMENGYFYYKELPSLSRVGNNPLVLEALAIAFELTGDETYLKAGRRTFEANVKGSLNGGGSGKRIVEDTVLVGNTGTKRFAQMFVPMMTYYKALADNDLL